MSERPYTKAEVDYVAHAKHRDEQCHDCRYFIGRSQCELVQGTISYVGWCAKFKRDS